MCVFSCSVLLVEIVDKEKEKETTGDKEKGEENSTTGQEEGDNHNKDTTTEKNGMTLFILINFNNLHAFVRDSAFLH